MALLGIDPLWQRLIAQAVETNRIEAIHVHDLPLVNTGLKVAKKMTLPLVADLHENHPEAVRFNREDWGSKITSFFMPEKRWKIFQREWLKRVDRLITVIDEIGQRLVSEYGVPPEKITIAMNATDLALFCNPSPSRYCK